jgi:NAD(P)-dependent dehydrogenase (short-subunit alcohol dehydrogenase family)
MSQVKSVLVTGTSTGIGRATALRLQRDGWRVFAAVRREADADSLRREAGDGLVPVQLEVTDEASVARAAKEIEAAVAPAGLGGLVNNAGISVGGPLEHLATDELRRQFEVNVFGPMTLVRALVPLLRVAKGRIVNVSSGAGKASTPLLGAYCASKFALEALSDALRLELRGQGIRVVVVEPGFVETPFVEKGRSETAEWRARLPEDAERYYGPGIDRFLGQVDRLAPMGSKPDDVARVIQRALTDTSPRARYTAGRDAKVLLALRRWLPDRAIDGILGRFTGF